MNENEKHIEEFIKGIEFDDVPNKNHRDSLERELLRAFPKHRLQRTAASVRKWRIIMNNKVTKFAAAAVILIAVGVSFTVMEKTTTSAYAFEQTLEAIQDIKTMHTMCRDWDNEEFEMWVQLNPETGIPDYCRTYWPGYGVLNISRPDRSYQYNEGANYVQVNSGKLYNIDVAPARIFEHLLQVSKTEDSDISIKFHHEIDEETGETLIVILFEAPGGGSKIYIDPETKLPIQIIGFKNNSLGAVFKDVYQIEYNVDLPEGIFDFQIPEGARVHDHDEFNKLLYDPENGISTEGLTEQQAADKIAGLYWNALIADDLEAMQKVFPSKQPRMTSGSLLVELVESGKLYIQNGCGIGKVLPCVVSFKDGTLKEFKIIIKTRNIDGKPSCIIAGQWGGPVEIE